MKRVSFLILAVICSVLVFGRMDETVEALGAVFPETYVNIVPEVSGIIKEVRVRDGDEVKAGDTIFLLASDELELRMEQSREAFEEAQVRLWEIEKEYENLTASGSYVTSAILADTLAARKRMEIVRTDYDRKQKLFERDLISREDRDRAKVDYELASSYYRVLKDRLTMLKDRYQRQIKKSKHSVELAQQGYDLAQRKLEKTIGTSSVDGTVLTSNTDQLVGTKAVEGQPLIQIGDLSQMTFVARVKESDIPRVLVGQEVKIYVNAFPHRQYKVFTGQITTISSAPKVTELGVIYETRIKIDKPWVEVSASRFYLKSGLSGKAKIVIERNVRLIESILKGIAK